MFIRKLSKKNTAKAFLFILSSVVSINGFSYTVDKDSKSLIPDKVFNEMHPYNYKYCATTQYSPKSGDGGGKAGHAFIVLSKVCLDKSQGPSVVPDMVMCDTLDDYKNGTLDINDPDLAMGISVDSALKNVKFFTIPGLNLSTGGRILGNNEIFDDKKKEEIIKLAMERGSFWGLDVHDSVYKNGGIDNPESLSREEKEKFIGSFALGTDYAISLGRNLYCQNIPITRSMTSNLVDELNKDRKAAPKDSSYRGVLTYDSKVDNSYHWDGIFDNCTHLAINSFAKLTGMLRPREINEPAVKQVFNLAIPANLHLFLFEAVNEGEIDILETWNDKTKRELFERVVYAGEGGWIGRQYGTYAEEIHVYGSNGDTSTAAKENVLNEIYYNSDKIFMQPSILGFGARANKMRIVGNDSRYSYMSMKSANSLEGFRGHLEFSLIRYEEALRLIEEGKKANQYVDSLKIIKDEKNLNLKIKILRNDLYIENTLLKKPKYSQGLAKRKLEKRIVRHEKKLGELQNDYFERIGRFAEAKRMIVFFTNFKNYISDKRKEVITLISKSYQ